MSKQMLIDAAHRDEMRVAITEDNKLQDYDYEIESRKSYKGSVFLATVTRVEPSLQAAFVNYGGNRHGFLPFSEIHPDYFRIPVEDREALKAEQEAVAASEEEEEEEEFAGEQSAEGESENENGVEELGGDAVERPAPPRPNLRKSYKIQEVVKRGQIMLIQVTKEERGNKGAAVTSYISLPGRYCVLMPNSPRRGGVSRKISNFKERRRMKELLQELNLPQGMSVIMRTAGLSRTKSEIRRDLNYLLRLWENIRETTLQSIAPALIYEEGNLIKRAIRDVYTRDIDEVVVSGQEGYKEAKDLMKMLVPSHAKKVQAYREEGGPLFVNYGIEDQIVNIHDPLVTLPSGGYLVIHPTEALVSVDVNSGRATKERNIENTALQTNLEAAEEVARQLRLRDLGGLVVIDFIDMEERKRNQQVERKIKEALSGDRARIQVGRISSFGLMELSRQRLRPSLTETNYEECPHCGGAGIQRNADSSAVLVLRTLEQEAARTEAKEFGEITAYVPQEVALKVLNDKRRWLSETEAQYGIEIRVYADPDLKRSESRILFGPDEIELEPARQKPEGKKGGKSGGKDSNPPKKSGRKPDRNAKDTASEESAEATTGSPEQNTEETGSDSKNQNRQGGKRRRGRRGGRRRSPSEFDENSGGEETPELTEASELSPTAPPEEPAPEQAPEQAEASQAQGKPKSSKSAPREEKAESKTSGRTGSNKTGKKPAASRQARAKPEEGGNAQKSGEGGGETLPEQPEPEPANDRAAAGTSQTEAETGQEAQHAGPKRKGWWQKLLEN